MRHFIKSASGEYRHLYKGHTEYRLYKSPVKGNKYALYIRGYDYDTGIVRFTIQGLFDNIRDA